MEKVLLYLLIIVALFSSCSNKKIRQGSVSYAIEYQLPDSLKKYLPYLPKSAMVYFKGDSAVSIQQQNGESTTVITCKNSDFMRVLLRSPIKKYVIDYNKAEQAQELASPKGYAYAATPETKNISGHLALRYTITNKATGESGEAWFTKEFSVVPNSLTTVFDTTYGVPLAFTTRQQGMVIKTTMKGIKFESVPEGIFSTPAGYEKLTPKQLRDMPVEN
jgi:hypothetical protein